MRKRRVVFSHDEIISVVLAAGMAVDPESITPLAARAAVYKAKALVESSQNDDGTYDIDFDISAR